MLWIYNAILFTMRKKKFLYLLTIWMKLEGIILNEITYRKTNSVSYHSYVDSKQPHSEKQEVER